MSELYKYRLPYGYYIGPVKNFGHKMINTVSAEPLIQDGFWPRWPVENPKATDWEYVENHKGKQGYVNGEPHTIKDYGPLPDGWSDTPPERSAAELQAELISSFMAAIQNRLDTFARSRSYDDARACVSVYLGCANETFAKEAKYMQESIVATWEWANTFTNAVLLGEKAMPETWQAFEAELDAAVPLEWPVPDTRVTAALGA